MKLTMEEKLEIVNSGGEIDEGQEHGTWKGAQIRKGEKLGKVIKDMNGYYRTLTVKFKDGTEEEISLNNTGKDPESVHQYEWNSKGTWYRF